MMIRALQNDFPRHRSGYQFDRPVVLLDNVVDVFALAYQNINASVSLDALSRNLAAK